MDADVVDGSTGESDGNPNERVDGVAVERNHHQENAAQAVNYWEEQGELHGGGGGWRDEKENKINKI